MPEVEERAILVGLELKGRLPFVPGGRQEERSESSEESMEELDTLARSAGARVVDRVLQVRAAIDAATLIGSGKVDELVRSVEAQGVDTVIFDRELTPTQQRNLERALSRKVVDRTQLILDIFARRARTREGQLQVELAQLNYMLPRLAGRGIEMSRLGGGIGTRGPGETQIETDRRRIARRIRKIEQQLEGVRAGRSIQRRQRQSVPLATVALVGYTNAGKSTLFNRLTGAGVTADARMFATLDPTVRQLTLPSNRKLLVSDTVGFIRHLPTTLVKAFRATLEEVTEATLLLHVIDASSPHAEPQTAHVQKVLAEIGAAATPQLLVLNKTDLLPDGGLEAERMLRRLTPQILERPADAAVAVSSKSGEGLERLLAMMDAALQLDPVAHAKFRFPAGAGSELHLLHEHARVKHTSYSDNECIVEAEVPASLRRRLSRYLVDKKAFKPAAGRLRKPETPSS